MINCLNCGKIFEPRTKKRGRPPKYCTLKCKKDYNDRNRGGKATMMSKKRYKIKEIELTCPICGNKFKDLSVSKSKSCPECRGKKDKQERNIVIKTICLGCGCLILNKSKNVQLFHNINCHHKFYYANKTVKETKKLIHDFAMAKLLGDHVQDLADFIDSAKLSDEIKYMRQKRPK